MGRPVGSRKAAARAWDKLRPDDNAISRMGFVLTRQIKTDLWSRGVGIPYASTWLNNFTEYDLPDDAPSDDFVPDDLLEV